MESICSATGLRGFRREAWAKQAGEIQRHLQTSSGARSSSRATSGSNWGGMCSRPSVDGPPVLACFVFFFIGKDVYVVKCRPSRELFFCYNKYYISYNAEAKE